MASGFSYGDFLSNTNQDLRFSASDGTTELNYEIEKWNTNGASFVWVQVGSLASTNDFVWAYWGRTAMVAPSYTTNGATWSTGFKSVYHFADASGNARDSTANRCAATNTGIGFVTSGMVANCAEVDSESDSFLIPVFTNGAFTASVWYYYGQTDGGSWNTVFAKDGGSYHHLLIQDSDRQVGFYNTSASPQFQGSGTILATQQWHYLTLAVSGTSCKLYLNGNMMPIEDKTTFFDNVANPLSRISTHNGTAQGAYGWLDEVRLETAVRTTNWIWACYMTMASNRAFSTYNSVEIQIQGKPFVENVGATNVLSTTAGLVGNIVATGSAPASVWVYWDTIDRGTNSLWAYTNGPTAATAVGQVTNTASGLSSNTTYWFTYYVSNSIGEGWAKPSLSFKTTGLPAVNNGVGATSLGHAQRGAHGWCFGKHPSAVGAGVGNARSHQ